MNRPHQARAKSGCRSGLVQKVPRNSRRLNGCRFCLSTGSGRLRAYAATSANPTTADTRNSSSMLDSKIELTQVAAMTPRFCAIPTMPEVLPYCRCGN